MRDGIMLIFQYFSKVSRIILSSTSSSLSNRNLNYMEIVDSGLSELSIKMYNRRGKTLFCKYFEPSDSSKTTPTKSKNETKFLQNSSEPSQFSKCRAIVFLSHGYGEHCLMYAPLARILASHNYFVMTHDHVGHGQSEGPRALIDTFEKYVDDVFLHIDVIKGRHPGLPVYICGHSMGGAIAILAALRSPHYFSGLILIAPAVKTDPHLTTPFKVNMAKHLRKIFPQFPVATLDLNLLCSCPETVKIMKADPYRYQGYCKAGFGASLIEAMEIIQENMNNVHLPFLLLQGEADKVCSPEGAAFMYETAQSPDKILKIYPRAYHSLLYEPYGIADQVKNDIVEWLNARARPRCSDYDTDVTFRHKF